MCKDKSKENCVICTHNGETRDCPNFKQKASCAGCGVTRYQKDMVFIEGYYFCEACAAEILQYAETGRVSR